MRAAAQKTPITPVLASSGTTLVWLTSEGKIQIYEGLPKPALKTTLSGSTPFDHVAISGDTILASSSNAEDGKGVVIVYKRQSGDWKETVKLAPTDAEDTAFGSALAIQGDTQLIGAKNGESSGGVQVAYKSSSTSGTALSTHLVFANNGGIAGSVLATDGDYLLVGLPGVGVQVFIRNADTWDKQTLLVPEAGDVPKSFGSAIAIAGRTVVIGAPDANAVYIFTRGDTAWAQRHLFNDEKNKNFGQAVAIYDTDILAVGTQGATIYVRENSPQWKPGATFTGSNFGSSATVAKGFAAVTSTDGIQTYEGKGSQWKAVGALK
jgi:hypothetical protein